MVPIPLAAFIFVVAVTRYVSAGSLLVTIIFLAEVICFGQRGDLRWRSLCVRIISGDVFTDGTGMVEASCKYKETVEWNREQNRVF